MNTTTATNKAIISQISFSNMISAAINEFTFFVKMTAFMAATILLLVSVWV